MTQQKRTALGAAALLLLVGGALALTGFQTLRKPASPVPDVVAPVSPADVVPAALAALDPAPVALPTDPVEAMRQEIAALEKRLAALPGEIGAQMQRMADLRAKLRRNDPASAAALAERNEALKRLDAEFEKHPDIRAMRNEMAEWKQRRVAWGQELAAMSTTLKDSRRRTLKSLQDTHMAELDALDAKVAAITAKYDAAAAARGEVRPSEEDQAKLDELHQKLRDAVTAYKAARAAAIAGTPDEVAMRAKFKAVGEQAASVHGKLRDLEAAILAKKTELRRLPEYADLMQLAAIEVGDVNAAIAANADYAAAVARRDELETTLGEVQEQLALLRQQLQLLDGARPDVDHVAQSPEATSDAR